MSSNFNVSNSRSPGLAPIVSGATAGSLVLTPRPIDAKTQSSAQPVFATPPAKSTSCCRDIKAIPVIGHIIRAIIWIFKNIFPCCFKAKGPQVVTPPHIPGSGTTTGTGGFSQLQSASEQAYQKSLTPQVMKPFLDTLAERAELYANSIAACPVNNIKDLVGLSALYEDMLILQGDLIAFDTQFKPDDSLSTDDVGKQSSCKTALSSCQALLPQCAVTINTVNAQIDTLKALVQSSELSIGNSLAETRHGLFAQINKCIAEPKNYNERMLLEYNLDSYLRCTNSLQSLGLTAIEADPTHQQIKGIAEQSRRAQHAFKPNRVWTQSALQDPQALLNRSSELVGIRNIGNSCYMNSSLQTLLAAPTFYRLVNTPLQRANLETNEQFQARGNIQMHLSFVLEAMRGGNADMIVYGMTQLRSAIFSDFSRQHLPTELKRHPGEIRNPMYAQHDGEAFINTALQLLGHSLQRQEVRTFTHGGVAMEHPMAGVDGDTMLRLAVVPGKTMNELWHNYFNPSEEINDPNNGFRHAITDAATNTVRNENITKYRTTSRIVGQIPDFIAVQVKRYEQINDAANPGNTVINKIATPIPCLEGKIDATKYIDPALLARAGVGRVEYQIVGIQEHLGDSPAGGHYISYRLGTDSKWRCYDDHKVRVVSDADIREKMSLGYNLMYARVS